jgi:hypothetical protein
MLNDSEWIEIYRYLLQKLPVSVDNSLIIDIERAVSARIEENVSEDKEIIKRFSKESRDDLDPIRLRAPTPREAFTAAIGVLIARLREVPVLSDRLAAKLNCKASDIQWNLDVSDRDRISEQVSLSAQNLTLKEEEIEEVESALKRLEKLLKYQQ